MGIDRTQNRKPQHKLDFSFYLLGCYTTFSISAPITAHVFMMSFVDFVTSFLREVIDHPGFLRSDISTQQQIHHLSFVCNLVSDSGGLSSPETIIEEHKLIKADIEFGFLSWENAEILKQKQQKMLQNLKMLGNSVAQTTIFYQFDDNHDQDYGDTEDSGQHLEPKKDNDIENAVRIQFTKKPK